MQSYFLTHMLIWEKWSVKSNDCNSQGMEQCHYQFPKLIQKRTQTLASYPEGKVPTNFNFQKIRTKTVASNPRGRQNVTVGSPKSPIPTPHRQTVTASAECNALVTGFCKKRISLCHTCYITISQQQNRLSLSLQLLHQNISNRDSKVVRNCPL